MSEIKLEVGKTYVNRRGEEVRIVRNDNTDRYYPYQGSDGEWYTESGRYAYSGPEHRKDLIAEVPETRHTFALVPEALTATRYTFTIPEGTKGINVSKEGNHIIVEMVPGKDPKPGDVMVNEHRSVYIFKAVTNNDYHTHYAWLAKPDRLFIDYGCCAPGRPATSEEAQPLWDALKKAGKRWNPEAMKVEDVPERERIMEYLQDCVHNTTWNHEQLCLVIEGYLIRKEYQK